MDFLLKCPTWFYNQPYLEETRKSAENLELRQSEAAAWSATYKKLWREFQCCYYTCNGLVFNAIGEDYIFEIYELAQEIAAPPTIPLPVERKITTKEEYRETWFNLWGSCLCHAERLGAGIEVWASRHLQHQHWRSACLHWKKQKYAPPSGVALGRHPNREWEKIPHTGRGKAARA